MIKQMRSIFVVVLLSSFVTAPLLAKKSGGAAAAAAAAAEHAAKGAQAIQAKQYDVAVTEFTQAIAADPKDPRMYADRAVALRAIPGRIEEALADCSKAIELDPKHYFGYMERSQTEMLMVQFDAALADANKVIELKPDEPNGYKFRGFAYAGLNQWDKAIADLNTAIEKKPDDVQSYARRAESYSKLKQYDQAIADFTTILTKDPNSVDVLVKRGVTYSTKEDYEKAIADFEAALKLKPDDEATVSRLQYARSMLAAKNAPPPTATPEPTPASGGLFTPLNIGIFLAVILILAVVIKLVTRGKSEAPTSSMRIR
jgi:tetratricopeptide (TPR) repeat protein